MLTKLNPPPEIKPGHTYIGTDEDGYHHVTLPLQEELEHLLNKHSAENGSNTPDFILAQYLMNCLQAYNVATTARAKWYAGSIAKIPNPQNEPTHESTNKPT